MPARRPRFRTSFSDHSPGRYGHLVGKLVDIITANFGNPHARLVIQVGEDNYEVDVNVYSTKKSAKYPNGSDVQFAIRDEPITGDPPAEGIDYTTTLSYVSLGLHQGDFTTVADDTLHDKLNDLARSCELVEVVGMIYEDANQQGIHDVHMNSGEGGHAATATSEDGAIAFYSLPENGQTFAPHAEWVFIKFQTQLLP